jgi:Tol biopolymer transport system component
VPSKRILSAATLAATLLSAAAATAGPSATIDADRTQTTTLISRGLHGRAPNGESAHAVISGDRRYARVIAFDSKASNLVRRDRNGSTTDVFIIKRAGSFGNNKGPKWKPGRTKLISRGRGRKGANGPSFLPAVGGNLDHRPKCIAFLSWASNLVRGDTNNSVDAFVSRGPGGRPRRVSKFRGHQMRANTTAVAVSGDCSRIAFVTGGKLYVRVGRRTVALRAPGTASDPSFAVGTGNDLVFAAAGGVYMSKKGTGRPKLVARDGRNPAYNDANRRTLVYEKSRGGRTQIYYKDLGKPERVISQLGGRVGNTDSFAPSIGNSGYYVTFETGAGNLGTNALRARADDNGAPDVYLYTDVRKLTLVQSVGHQKGYPLPGGGKHPSMSYYANYILFDSPSPLGRTHGDRQVFMRYLGPV